VTEDGKRQEEIEDEEDTGLSVLYAYTTSTPDGREAIVSVEQPSNSITVMVTLSKKIAENMRTMAQTVADTINRPVTLVKFEKRTEVERLTPSKIIQLH
jgi:hypothetical protein